jgi:hypothetical protein
MRREHAQHARAARKQTVAYRPGARGLSPRAFRAKRRSQPIERKRQLSLDSKAYSAESHTNS